MTDTASYFTGIVPPSGESAGIAKRLSRLATWLQVAEETFGGLPENATMQEAWTAMFDAANTIDSLTSITAEQAERIKRLEDELGTVKASLAALDAHTVAAGDLDMANERIKRLEEALEPFALAARAWNNEGDPWWSDNATVAFLPFSSAPPGTKNPDCTVGDLRRAALTHTGGK